MFIEVKHFHSTQLGSKISVHRAMQSLAVLRSSDKNVYYTVREIYDYLSVTYTSYILEEMSTD